MRAIAFAAASLLCTMLCSCRHEGAAGGVRAPVYAGFFIRYMESARTIKANASFYEGDAVATARPIQLEGGVSFLGSAMQMRDLHGAEIRYTTERKIDFINDYTFRFSDSGSKLREVKATMHQVGAPAFKAPASKSTGLVLTYEGTPLSAGEQLVVLLSNAEGQTWSLNIYGPQQGTELVLPAGQAAMLPTGRLEGYAVRKKKREYKEDRFDMVLEAEYYSATATFEITP